MSTLELTLWAIALIIQNFSFTLVSRARNSSSYLYHGLAAIGSNGVWFATNLFLVYNIITLVKNSDVMTAVWLGIFYTIFTVTGSLVSHWVCMKYFEKPKLPTPKFKTKEECDELEKWVNFLVRQRQEQVERLRNQRGISIIKPGHEDVTAFGKKGA